MNTPTVQRAGMARTLEMIDPHRCPAIEVTRYGYADALGDDAPPVHTAAQRLMRTSVYSAGYQIVRPFGLKLFAGVKAPGRDEDRARISASLGLHPGARVIDIGCGPGNFTGWFGSQVVPDGVAVGVDASHQMLRRAVADNAGPGVSYLRGDAENLPFADGVADAVSCLAALYLLNKPFRAIAEMGRVVKPGGRVVILTSLAPGGRSQSVLSTALERIGGVRMFGINEITASLQEAGFGEIEQVVGGLVQTVTATRA